VATLTHEQIAETLRDVGFTAGAAVILTAIAPCESGDDDTIVQSGQPYDTTGWGLWQITPGDSVPQVAINDGLLAPVPNARAAKVKSNDGTDFTPWTTYVDGCYRQYLAAAEAAVAAAYKLPIDQVRRQVAALPTGGRSGGPDAGSAHDWSPQVKLASGHLAAHGLHLAAAHQVLHGLAAHLTVPKVTVPAPDKVLLPARRFDGTE
jgi:lysozyme-like protein